ncbi:MAG: hypothetical protein K6G68_12420 [Oscillospiraceae bacterium]|nr:hypothetical protein [Oscillospiraceae bacterium]
MKKNKKRTIASVFACAAAVAAITANIPKISAVTYSGGTVDMGTYTTTFDKYLVISSDSNVPEATFNFTIEPGEAVAPTDTTKEVLAGEGTPVFVENDYAHTGSNTAGEVKFTHLDEVVKESSARDGDNPAFATPDNKTDEKYAHKMLTLDFKDVAFTQPGIYRYIIKEKPLATPIPGIDNDPVPERTLDVYVIDVTTDENDPKLGIEGYVMYSGVITAAPLKDSVDPDTHDVVSYPAADASEKSKSYTNKQASRNLTFGKEVTGNQGAKDKYFKFTLEITNAGNCTLNLVYRADEFDVSTTQTSATKYTTTVMNEANSVDVLPDMEGQQIQTKSGSLTHEFYLRDGQYLTVQGLPVGAHYKLTEDAEDYTPTDGTDKEVRAATASTPAKAYDDATEGDIADADIYTGFTNKRSGSIPTGVLLSVAAPAGIGGAVLGGIIYLVVKKRKDDDDDEE